jgi:tRNA(Phe) wybutosine-synthesizing methylase Tyw3
MALNKRIMVEIKSAECVSLIIKKRGELLVHQRYLSVLCDEMRKRLSENEKRVDKLYSFLQRLVNNYHS